MECYCGRGLLSVGFRQKSRDDVVSPFTDASVDSALAIVRTRLQNDFGMTDSLHSSIENKVGQEDQYCPSML